jgi:hypothetical protein
VDRTGTGLSPESADTRLLRQSSWPVIEPFHEVIRDLLCTVTVSMIHQRLRDKRPLIHQRAGSGASPTKPTPSRAPSVTDPMQRGPSLNLSSSAN